MTSVFKYCDRRYITSSAEVKELVDFIKRTYPKHAVQPPKWNLPFVLHRLSEAPFEPLETVGFKYLTWKTVFLLLWGTACRRSEIHGIDVNSITHNANWSRVEMALLPEVFAKNQYLDDPSVQRTYSLEALIKASSQDALLCPIRALRIYLSRTKPVRGPRRRLFLPLVPAGDKPRDITANTVSSWVKHTVMQAYARSTRPTHDQELRQLYGVDEKEVANFHRAAHESRAQSASYRFDKSHPSLAAIMKACYWRSSNVFINFYLREITMEDKEHLHRLSSLVLPGSKDVQRPSQP